MLALAPAHLAAASVLAAGWGTHTSVLTRRLASARRDPLTALPTRDAFTRRAARILARRPALVLLIDLDRFKPLNDTHGHAAGDAALTAVAARLAAWAGPRAALARLGGDEFAAVIPTGNEPPNPLTLHRALTAPMPYDGANLSVGASIGATTSTPHGPIAPGLAAALARADTAMYAAKHAGGGLRFTPWPGTTHTGAPHRWKRNHPHPDPATLPTTAKD